MISNDGPGYIGYNYTGMALNQVTVGQHPAIDEFIFFELLTVLTLQYIQIHVFIIKSQKYRLDHYFFQLLFGSPDLMFLGDLPI